MTRADWKIVLEGIAWIIGIGVGMACGYAVGLFLRAAIESIQIGCS